MNINLLYSTIIVCCFVGIIGYPMSILSTYTGIQQRDNECIEHQFSKVDLADWLYTSGVVGIFLNTSSIIFLGSAGICIANNGGKFARFTIVTNSGFTTAYIIYAFVYGVIGAYILHSDSKCFNNSLGIYGVIQIIFMVLMSFVYFSQLLLLVVCHNVLETRFEKFKDTYSQRVPIKKGMIIELP